MSRKATGCSEPVDECRLPKPHRAKEEFVRAMEVWDAEAADAAVAALCRSSGAAQTMEPLWRVAVRDQRNIGHKAIFAAQSWRTLQTIGWEHAEPVLRSLVFGMLDLQGDTRPRPVGPYEANLENAAKIREEWTVGRDDPAATQALLQVIREATPEAASAEAVKLLNQGICTRLALGRRDPRGVRALDAQPGHPRPSRHHGDQRTPLHLHSQRRRYDSPAGPASGGRLAADVPRPHQAHRRDRHRRAQSQPGYPALERRRGGRRDLRDDQRRPQESRPPRRWPTWRAVARRISSSTPPGG